SQLIWALAYLDPGGAHRLFRLPDGELAVVEDRGGEHRVGAADHDAVYQVLQAAHAAGGDHGHIDGLHDRAREVEIETVPHAVTVHAGEQDLAGAEPRDPPRPLDSVEPGRRAPAVRVDLPAARWRAARVDGRDDALRPVALRSLGEQSGSLHPGGVDAHLVRARVEQGADVVGSRHAAADGERNEHLVGHGLDHVVEQRPRFHARGYVEKRQLVGSLRVVAARHLDRVPGVAQIDEVDALDDAPLGDVQARDDALRQTHGL